MGTINKNMNGGFILLSKTLFIIGGGVETIPGVHLAKKMGLYVVVSDMNPKAPCFAVADDHIIASTYDIGATIKAAQKYHRTIRPINGAICIGSDIPLTVASVANALNLPGISLKAARLSMDKITMKHKFKKDNIPIPWFSIVESIDHLQRIVKTQGYPLVLKPVDSRGARGVLRLTRDVNLEFAYLLSKKYSSTGRVMVERFLSGPQISTESIVLDGIVYTLGFADRNYEYLEHFAPHIIENGGELPSHLLPEEQKAICDLVQRAALSMGITDGIVKGDIVLNNGNPYIIELAARLSGGYFCTHEIPLNIGVNFVAQAICLALGEKIKLTELTPKFNKGVAQRYFFPTPGRVIRITGVEKVKQRPEIALCEIRVVTGDIIKPIESHPERAGVVIATGENRKIALKNVLNGIKEIEIETKKI